MSRVVSSKRDLEYKCETVLSKTLSTVYISTFLISYIPTSLTPSIAPSCTHSPFPPTLPSHLPSFPLSFLPSLPYSIPLLSVLFLSFLLTLHLVCTSSPCSKVLLPLSGELYDQWANRSSPVGSPQSCREMEGAHGPYQAYHSPGHCS